MGLYMVGIDSSLQKLNTIIRHYMTNGPCIINWADEQVCEKYVKQIKTENEWVGIFCNIYNEKRKGREKKSFVIATKTFMGTLVRTLEGGRRYF